MSDRVKTLAKKLNFIAVAALLFFIFTASPSLAALSFSDVSKNYWAHAEITELADKGIIKGHMDGTFRPHDSVTRAQSAMMIVRALNIPTENRPDPNFQDVSPATPGYAEIAALVDLGVFAKDENFNPTQPATRAQVAKILVEAFDLKGSGSGIKAFTDVSASQWYYSYVDTLVHNGITTGTTKTTFSPNQHVNRVQMAVFIYRIQNAEGPTSPGVPAGEAAMMTEVLNLVNQERAKAGVPAVKLHKGLQDAALIKSKDMADNNYFSHQSPTYGSPFDLLKARGISYTAAGENIAAGQRSAASVMVSWMNSPGHKANVLNKNYTHLGVGIYKGGSYGIYHTQLFIRQ
ncbi:S-layer homology domain-containing protein [Planococcus soli]|uniref:S-layer homology domain-containing protein n=1 Tax=Planococcus soli TaxID=2666072 RepID=UPI00115E69A1|nr:S-layer homology domain-containing protein [Planococcus soli]